MEKKLIFLLTFILLSNISCILLAANTNNDKKSSKRPKIGLVLSGGGAKGLAHIGVIKVLERAGIEVDCITGTSMGSIIGGLYAIGYDADQLEEIALDMNWSEMLKDEIPLTSISIEEKEYENKYIMTFPLNGFNLELPRGLIAGQKLSAKLSRLTLPVYDITNFHNLYVPFSCVATDIVTGKAVVLKKGNLAEALRASMAIPSVFTPIKIDNHLLVDGGLVRNFPVDDVIDLGADIIIGVDVGTPLYKEEELNSFLDIMTQSVSFYGASTNKEQVDKCDIIITPELSAFSSANFNNPDSIITLGEIAAEKQFKNLKSLADSINAFLPVERNVSTPAIYDRFYISELKIKGLKNISKKVVYTKSRLKPNSYLTPDEIDEAIARLYGSRFFERVSYSLEPINGDKKRNKLTINIIESEKNLFRFGLHYDNDVKSSFFFNATFRNKYFDGTRLSIDARLSEDPDFKFSYHYHTGWRPNIGIKFFGRLYQLTSSLYDADREIISNPKIKNIIVGGAISASMFNDASVFAGIENECSTINLNYNTMLDSVMYDYNSEIEMNMINFNINLELNTADRAIYPHSGVKLNLRSEFISGKSNEKYMFKNLTSLDSLIKTDNIATGANETNYKKFQRLHLEFERYIPVKDYLTLQYFLFAGINTFKNNTEFPTNYSFFIGGNDRRINSLIPFVGYNFMEKSARNILKLQIDVQLEVFNDKYVILKGNLATISNDYKELFEYDNIKRDDLLYGYGLTLGMNTLIGPLEFSVMKGDLNRDILTRIDIGYRF